MKKLKSVLLRIYHVKALKYIVVAVIGVAMIGFVDENSVWHHMVNRQRISELEGEIDRYINLNNNNQAQINQLDNDPKAIKKIARERYFMKSDDEDIFVLSDDEQTGKSILNNETIEQVGGHPPVSGRLVDGCGCWCQCPVLFVGSICVCSRFPVVCRYAATPALRGEELHHSPFTPHPGGQRRAVPLGRFTYARQPVKLSASRPAELYKICT